MQLVHRAVAAGAHPDVAAGPAGQHEGEILRAHAGRGRAVDPGLAHDLGRRVRTQPRLVRRVDRGRVARRHLDRAGDALGQADPLDDLLDAAGSGASRVSSRKVRMVPQSSTRSGTTL